MRLRELLLHAHLLDASTLAQAEAHAAATAQPLVHVLVSYQVVEGRRLARLLSRALHFELIDVFAVEIHPRLLEVVPRKAAEQFRILPIGVKQGLQRQQLYLAMSDPSDDAAISAVEAATGLSVEPLVCDDLVLQASFDKHYGAPAVAGDVLVGALVEEPNHEFLTESTAEALRYVQNVRSADVVMEAALDGPTIDFTRQRRPASIALASVLVGMPGEVTLETERPRRGTQATTAAALGNEPTVAISAIRTDRHKLGMTTDSEDVEPELPVDEALFAPTKEMALEGVTLRGPSLSDSEAIVVAYQGDPLVRAELHELLAGVIVVDDDVAACLAAVTCGALVLISPRTSSGLLRALLDLEELESRPRIVVLGGDPALRVLAFVDEYGEMPSEPRAVAIAVLAALRQSGVAV